MQCFMCGTEVGREATCPNCGANVLVYKQIQYFSSMYYNQGLEKAKVRDLSGAEECLKRSLSYSKYNIPARNLLGLIYYEIGETVEAINEWILVKNYDPENELATRYLSEIENTPGLLSRINTTIKKYNQALEYCKNGSPDLAVIQLKKILSTNARLVKAYQLLALLYIKDARYNDARKQLLEANKIDNNNTITLTYLQEIKAELKAGIRTKKRKKAETVAMTNGNDMVLMPGNSFHSIMEGTRNSLFNLLVGFGIGMLICFFLVVPSVKQEMGSSDSRALVEANESLSRANNHITELQVKLSEVSAELDRYTGRKDVVESYEVLITTTKMLDGGQRTAAEEEIQAIDRELLGEKGKSLYDSVYKNLSPELCKQFYTEGKAFYEATNYDSAVSNLQKVVDMDEKYERGQALYLLADSLRLSGDSENATKYYSKVVELYPNSNWGESAADYLTIVGERDEN